MSVTIGTALVEVYFILGPPVQAYEKKGVWAEVLRFLNGRGIVGGQKEPADVTVKVTGHCHSNHRLKYDTSKGEHHYGVSSLGGGTFQLNNYLERTVVKCNCYDQCSAVHVLAGAVGVHLDWLYLRPFGFIKATNLVGIGMCNNPFFTVAGGDKMMHVDDVGFGPRFSGAPKEGRGRLRRAPPGKRNETRVRRGEHRRSP